MAGPHPQDAADFAARHLPSLVDATRDLSWLLERGYSEVAGLKLVGDRFQLTKRQRMAVSRASWPDPVARQRRLTRVGIAGRHVAVDGFNQMVTTERGLAGGAVFRGRDGAIRDVASVHGTWRRSDGTMAALDALHEQLRPAASVLWILDAPVSNAGRLAGWLREREPSWTVVLEQRADPALAATGLVLATGDGILLDQAPGWVPLAEMALAAAGIRPIDLSGDPDPAGSAEGSPR